MLELAARYSTREPVRIRTIADEHGIPSRFLVQILLQLKGAGFVSSTRGASGGYQLAKPPGEVSLGEVMTVIEGQDPELDNSNHVHRSPTAQVLAQTWQETAQVQFDMLRSVTFADLVERVKRRAENMYYI